MHVCANQLTAYLAKCNYENCFLLTPGHSPCASGRQLDDSTQLSLLTTQNMAWYIISWCSCQRAYWSSDH